MILSLVIRAIYSLVEIDVTGRVNRIALRSHRVFLHNPFDSRFEMQQNFAINIGNIT